MIGLVSNPAVTTNPYALIGSQILSSMFAPDSDQSATGGTSLSGQGAFGGLNDISKNPWFDLGTPTGVAVACGVVLAGLLVYKKFRG